MQTASIIFMILCGAVIVIGCYLTLKDKADAKRKAIEIREEETKSAREREKAFKFNGLQGVRKYQERYSGELGNENFATTEMVI